MPPNTEPAGPHAPVRLRLRRIRRALRRGMLGHRRLLAAALVVVAVVAGLRAVAAPAPQTLAVLVASRDLPSGTVLAAGDLETRATPEASVPPRPLSTGTAVGRVLASPVDAGEALTETRLVGPAMLDIEPGRVAVPVRLPDAPMAALLRVGDRVDLLASELTAGGARDPATVVASDVPVLAMPARDDATGGVAPAGGGAGGRLVVLGVAADDVTRLASSTAASYVTFAWRGR